MHCHGDEWLGVDVSAPCARGWYQTVGLFVMSESAPISFAADALVLWFKVQKGWSQVPVCTLQDGQGPCLESCPQHASTLSITHCAFCGADVLMIGR
jgi:hypothetical protein